MEQILENILQEINRASRRMCTNEVPAKYYRAIGTRKAEEIIRKHLSGKETDVFPNAGWIPVEERLPERQHEAVLCITNKRCYFVAVYNSEYGFRTEDIGVEGRIAAWQPLPKPPYREEGANE